MDEEGTLNAYSLHVDIQFVDSFVCSVKIVMNYCCIREIASASLSFVRTKAASNGCKRTRWKKNSYGI